MLYIRQYDKFNLDKSSINQYNYYRTKFNDLSIDIDALLAELQSLLDTIQVLRQQLNDNKDMLYDILNDTKSVFAQAKVSADSAFDYIENLLDNAEQALDSLEENINNTIQEILDDCSQVVDCSEVDCAEGVNSDEGVVTPTTPTVEPSSCGEPGTPDCTFCSYDERDASGYLNDECTVCAFGECTVDVSTGEECGLHIGEFDNCAYSSYTDLACGETQTHNADCSEDTCTYHGTVDSSCSNNYGSDCTFNCTHATDCNESEMPADCTYGCDDGGCVYSGGADCTYTSNGNEVDDDCGEEIIECVLYGSECFETECGEACGNCGQDCSEDCGDSGDWCGEDDTGCSEDDCCVYGGGSQSEGDDECGEDCGDCCVYG